MMVVYGRKANVRSWTKRVANLSMSAFLARCPAFMSGFFVLYFYKGTIFFLIFGQKG